MNSQTSRNAVVGFFFLVAIALFVVISVILSGAQEALERTTTYRVQFALNPGVAGLAKGAAVNLGGQRVGRVSDISITTDEIGRPQAIEVEVKIRSGLLLYENSDFQLKAPLLGAGAIIDIVGVGAPTPSATSPSPSNELDAGEMVLGRIAPPQFLEHAGFGPEQAEQVRQVIADAQNIMMRIDRILEDVEPATTEITGDVRLAAADIRAMTADVRAELAGWTQMVTSALASAEQTAFTLQRSSVALERGGSQAAELIDMVRGAVDENLPRIERILANADASLADIRENILPEVTEAAARGRSGADDFARIAEDLRLLVVEEAPAVRRTISSARLAADQLKHATTEIRQSPWRLLQRPQKRELESELIYNAAGLLAASASDLNSAAAALNAASDEAPPEIIDRLTTEVTEALREYREAQSALMELFAGEGG